jgi:hypothetical protein
MNEVYREQYCKIGDHWAPSTEFYDIRKGYHGNRTWCKKCTKEYHKNHNAKKKRLWRKLIIFWNKHHEQKVPMPQQRRSSTYMSPSE